MRRRDQLGSNNIRGRLNETIRDREKVSGGAKSRTRPCLQNSESRCVAAVWYHADPQHAGVRLEVAGGKAGGAGSGVLRAVRAGADCRLGTF